MVAVLLPDARKSCFVLSDSTYNIKVIQVSKIFYRFRGAHFPITQNDQEILPLLCVVNRGLTEQNLNR